ncbi:MAG: pilus assembly protein [Kiloniellales bacterium]|nr:pilus assembly protein [Kiloniellales bacterium]MDJ0981837.1 pilus assembly protein [Kiloniellales bacterium]
MWPKPGSCRLTQLRSYAADESGAATAILAATLVVLIGAAGLAFDAGRGYMVNARLSQAVDAAALAGGRSLTIGGGGDYAAQITKYFDANFPNGYMGADVSQPDITVNAEGDEITVAATASIPTTLMRVLSVQNVEVSARATVNRTIKGLEVAMVLDNSGSMKGSKLGDLKDSSKLLLDILYGDNDSVEDLYVALVPFTARSNVTGFPSVHPVSPPDPDLVCLNPRSAPHDTSDSSPVDAPFSHYSGAYAPPQSDYADRICPEAAVLPLVESKSAVKSAIDDMNAKGCTRYDVGSVWGWRTLSPSWRTFWENNTLPLDYGTELMDKAIIIMTDGANTPNCAGDPQSTAQTEAMFAAQCQAMKTQGVIIYTITFQLNDPATNALFESCASGTARYFKSPSGEQLELAFTTIANDLSTLRLTQ